MSDVVSRFIRYAKTDTQSADGTGKYPSTDKQVRFMEQLADELNSMGARGVEVDGWGCLYASIPATDGKSKPVLGLIAHVDTSDAAPGAGVEPRIERNYNGGDIRLNAGGDIRLSPVDFPELKKYIGQDLIVTDGATLLGADDKAGVAEIMQAVEIMLSHPERPHCEIRIAFTPDEEIGCGADHFDIKRFGADFAYTVDGGAIGEINYECFNAASARLAVSGRSAHPGDAKGKMKNAMLMAMEFNSMLPAGEVPSETEGYEGFFHLCQMSGSVEQAQLDYIIRDHDLEKFEDRKRLFSDIAGRLNKKYGGGSFTPFIKDSYFNLREKIAPHMYLIDNARAAFSANGVEPFTEPIRGGTDGSRLSYMGLPCPNISTGGCNFHSRFEYIPVQSLEKMVGVLLTLAELSGGSPSAR